MINVKMRNFEQKKQKKNKILLKRDISLFPLNEKYLLYCQFASQKYIEFSKKNIFYRLQQMHRDLVW